MWRRERGAPPACWPSCIAASPATLQESSCVYFHMKCHHHLSPVIPTSQAKAGTSGAGSGRAVPHLARGELGRAAGQRGALLGGRRLGGGRGRRARLGGGRRGRGLALRRARARQCRVQLLLGLSARPAPCLTLTLRVTFRVTLSCLQTACVPAITGAAHALARPCAAHALLGSATRQDPGRQIANPLFGG